MLYKKIIEDWDDAIMGKEMDDEYPGNFDRGVEFLTKRKVKDPKAFLLNFSQKVLRDSTKFFSYKKVKEFDLDKDILSFESPITNPLQINHTAYARVWRANNSKKAVIVVPHRCASQEDYIELCESLHMLGFTVLRLTMPYHERRKPSTRKNAKYMVSPNVGLTINMVRQATIEVRALVDRLAAQGMEDIGIVGSSIGSCVAFLASVHDPRIQASVFVHMSSYFGDVVYTGKCTRHVKKVMQGSLTQEQARALWAVISPISYIAKLEYTVPKHYIICGALDTTFRYSLTQQVFNMYEKLHIPFKKTVLPVGHSTIGKFPIKYYLGGCIITYLIQHIGKCSLRAWIKRLIIPISSQRERFVRIGTSSIASRHEY